MTIRLAQLQDAPALRRLNEAFNEVTDVSDDAIRTALARNSEIVVVAECGGEAIAFCCAQVKHSFCYAAPVAEVTEMYVDEAYRRQGLAQGMLTFLEKHVRDAYGVDEMHLLTGCANHAAQSAYRRAGFVEKREVYMRKELP
ncbi:MAG: GNAT family N-acetyltransferase [Clostridia bacterium]|nr:GNAT family N-acetyltransferase [Clostridia bacterium]